MRGHRPAKVIAQMTGWQPGSCEVHGAHPSSGLFVRWARALFPGDLVPDAAITQAALTIALRSKTFAQDVLFIVDTGADHTVIPAHLLGRRGPRQADSPARRPILINTPGGQSLLGWRFDGSVCLEPPPPKKGQPKKGQPKKDQPKKVQPKKVQPIIFTDLIVRVVYDGVDKWQYGMLGLDALRQIVTVCDDQSVSFWAR